MAGRVALTFDDGPGPSTAGLLDVLRRHRARATFFVLGRNLLGAALGGDAAGARETVARAVREGHLVGSHTMTHLPELDRRELGRELDEADGLLREVYALAGRDAPDPIPVRLPFGHFRSDHPRSMEVLARIGRPHCHWTGMFRDWEPDRTGEQIAAEMRAHVAAQWARGRTAVIVLHDAGQGSVGGGEAFGVVRDATVSAVDLACAWLRSRGCSFETVLECEPEALRFDPAAADAAP